MALSDTLKKMKGGDKKDEEKDEKSDSYEMDAKEKKDEKSDDADSGSAFESIKEEIGKGADSEGSDDAAPDVPVGDEPETQAGDSPEAAFAEAAGFEETEGAAMYAIASSMPKYADMDPKQMGAKIKGDYDALKELLTEAGRRAQQMQMDQMNAPMPEPGAEMGPGAPGPMDTPL